MSRGIVGVGSTSSNVSGQRDVSQMHDKNLLWNAIEIAARAPKSNLQSVTAISQSNA
jgi:hypothetical protein